MPKTSYCATHNTYPAPNEPCWQCANPFIEQGIADGLSSERKAGALLAINNLEGRLVANGHSLSALLQAAVLPDPAELLEDWWFL